MTLFHAASTIFHPIQLGNAANVSFLKCFIEASLSCYVDDGAPIGKTISNGHNASICTH